MLALPYTFFQGRKTGELLSRLSSNMMIRETLTNQTLSAILDGALVLVYLAILLLRAPLIGALALGLGLLQLAILVGTAGRIHRLMRRDLAAQAESQSYLVEALKGIALLKASGIEYRALAQWSNLFFGQLNISLQRGRLAAIVDTTMAAMRIGAPLLLLWVGAGQVLNGSMSLGTMLALNALAVAVLLPLASLVATGQQWQLAASHFERIADVVTAMPEQTLSPGAASAVRTAGPLRGRIEVRDVGFRYSPTTPPVLHDISFTVEPGQKVALVGRSGSGKSTLLSLLLGLVTPTDGEILYDDVPVTELDLRSVRSQLGVVLQGTFLFSSSIRQNIAFADPSLSLAQVTDAARLAAIHDEITALPMGYDTVLAEGGASLSGGQRQRLELARAVAHRPAILVLDEATSHLDLLAERVVDDNLSALACTRIVVAHRLSTIRNADLIMVLRDGAIVERGTHADLLAQDGDYAALMRSQLASEGAAIDPPGQCWPSGDREVLAG
jgi:ABC-type bacteriocin/lantibiotic exporter with double-glycine peptidase domain